MALDEEGKVIEAEQNSTEVISAFNRIPYSLINQEATRPARDLLAEFTEIARDYKVYERGADFFTEGSNGDYTPSNMHYKMSASLIDKEARFLFAEAPDISVTDSSDSTKPSEDAKQVLDNINGMLQAIFKENMFDGQLLKAAKDCFIGKRVAGLVNFNDDGVTINFLPATQFIYEYKLGTKELEKFVAFIIVRDAINLSDRKIFMKKYQLVEQPAGQDDKVYLTEAMYDGGGHLLEQYEEDQELMIPFIPAVVILNDGLTGDIYGKSEIEILKDYESWYAKLANADADAERKSMNPVKYTVDMDSRSTKNLSTAAGAYWDLGSDQNLDHPSPSVGSIESNMAYSGALKTTLDRIKTVGYEQVDVPNITLESMTGAITSGKALKAVYWPLIVRCKEKMKTWGPQLEKMVRQIIDCAVAFPECISKYVNGPVYGVPYEIHIDQKLPLPEDEVEEKTMDLSEVQSNTMSRKSYMKKWRDLTDEEVQDELNQMALERQLIDDASFPTVDTSSTGEPYNEEPDETNVLQSQEQQDGAQEVQDAKDDAESIFG
jgi:hypothetical protein